MHRVAACTTTTHRLALYEPAEAAAPRDELSKIMSAIDRTATGKKRPPSFFFNEAYVRELTKYKRLDAAEAAVAAVTPAVDASPFVGWSCQSCGVADASKRVLADDKSGFVCTGCGACDSGNFNETDYQARMRGSATKADATASLTAAEFESAAHRRRALESQQRVTGSVPSALRSQQEKLVRAATRENLLIENLKPRDKRRMDKSIITVHAIFKAASLDPDTSPLCKNASSAAQQLFLRSGSHMLSCENCTKTCLTSMIKNADHRLVAKACVARIVDAASEAADRDEAYEGIGTFEIKAMSRGLEAELAPYRKNVSVARDSSATVSRILTASALTLATPCSEFEETEDAEPVINAVYDEHDDGGGVDAFLQKIALSIESAASMGWVDARTAEAAQRNVVGVTFYDWVCNVSHWPPDVAALMLALRVVAASGRKTSSLRQTLKKLAKQAKISFDTVQLSVDSMPVPLVCA